MRHTMVGQVSRLRGLGGWLLVACWFVTAIDPTWAGAPVTTAANEPSASVTIEDLAVRRRELAKQMAELQKAAKSQEATEDEGEVSASDDELEYLETLDGVYAQQKVRLEQRQEFQERKKKVEQEAVALEQFGLTEAKPYSFTLVERWRDELSAEEDHEAATAADLKAAEQLLESAQDHLHDAEKERRQAQEEVAENEDPDEKAALENALKLAKRQSQIAKEMILVRQLEVEVRTLRNEVSSARKTLLESKLERVGQDVQFTKQDLRDRYKAIAAFDAEINTRLKAARMRFWKAEGEQMATMKKMQAEQAPQSTIELAQQSWRVARDAQQVAMSLMNERIGANKRIKHYWNCRFEVENGSAKPTEIQGWYESLSDFIDEIIDNRRSLEQRIEATRLDQAKLVERMRNSDDPAVEHWAEFQIDELHELRDACETELVQWKVDQRWADRFLEELELKIAPTTAHSWWNAIKNHTEAAWDYEIVSVEDRPITIGKIVKLVIYLSFGIVLASALSRILGARILPRFGLNEGAAHAVRSIAFYGMSMLFGVVSFELVHIPLTAFAFLGGAVAIAVGFGSQEIANNFMSGIILLAEQPIRVGDVVLNDGVQGTVEHIGARSTRIRTAANHELILPNSKLLSDKVMNLTLSDKLIQTAVAVSTPPRLSVQHAKRLLLEAALSNPAVLQEPEPIVLFKGFSSNAIDFELHFWLELTSDMRAAVAQSEVREVICSLFQQNDAVPTIAPLSVSGAAQGPATRKAA